MLGSIFVYGPCALWASCQQCQHMSGLKRLAAEALVCKTGPNTHCTEGWTSHTFTTVLKKQCTIITTAGITDPYSVLRQCNRGIFNKWFIGSNICQGNVRLIQLLIIFKHRLYVLCQCLLITHSLCEKCQTQVGRKGFQMPCSVWTFLAACCIMTRMNAVSPNAAVSQ